MNFFSKLFSGIKKIFGAGKSVYVRAGLGQYFDRYIPVAIDILTKLLAADSNAKLADVKDEAFKQLKATSKELSDNWVVLAIHAAYELIKAQSATKVEKL